MISNVLSPYFMNVRNKLESCLSLVPDMFRNFYLEISHKIISSSATTDAGEKISSDLESLEFYQCFGT